MDWKKLGALGLGGVVTAIVGGFVKPLVDSTLTMIPNFVLVGTSIPHDLISYGAAFFVGMMAHDWVKK